MLVLLVAVFAATRKPREEMAAEEERPLLIRTVTVEPRTMPDTLLLPGRVEPVVSAELSAEKAGNVTVLAVEKGDEVAAGQVLLRLDDRAWKNLHRRARIESENADRELERWQEVKKTGGVSESDFAAIRQRKELAEAALQQSVGDRGHADFLQGFEEFVGEVDVGIADHGVAPSGSSGPLFNILSIL